MGFSRGLKIGASILGLVGILSCTSNSFAQKVFSGDGSDEPGFVPPPAQVLMPPPPPARMSSGESFVPYPPPPVVPQARSEKKNPPTPPILMTKLRQGNMLEWNAIPNDVNNFLKLIKERAGMSYGSEVKSLEETASNPEKNPILFKGGHYHFSFSQDERRMLREYLLKGGTIIFDTSLGSKPFYDSARKELELIFPESPIQKLNLDHAVFHAYYDLGNDEKVNPWIEGVSINCRTLAFLSRWGIGVGWAEDEKNIFQAYTPEYAQKLGVNIMTYSVAQRAWAKNLVNTLSFQDSSNLKAGKLGLAQIVYDGEWKTRHKGISVLLSQFNNRTKVPVTFGVNEMRLSSPELFNQPLIYLTGHEGVKLNNLEKKNLREYLKAGGLLFAEACCGRKAFDTSFRNLMVEILPEEQMLQAPAGDILYSLPNKIVEVGITPGLQNLAGKSTIPPRLEEIRINERLAVIYSPYGMSGGWELSQNSYALGYNDESSLRLGENIIFNALTN